MTNLKRELDKSGYLYVDLSSTGTVKLELQKYHLKDALINRPNFIKDMISAKGSFSSSILKLYDYAIISSTVRGYIQNALDLDVKFNLADMTLNGSSIKLFIQETENSGFCLNIAGLYEYCDIPLVKEQEEIKLF